LYVGSVASARGARSGATCAIAANGIIAAETANIKTHNFLFNVKLSSIPRESLCRSRRKGVVESFGQLCNALRTV
jgi:hypothetical protein